MPGVLGGVLGVAVVCIAGYGFFRYKTRRNTGRPFFRDSKNRLGSVDYDAQAKSSVASQYRSDNNSQQFIPDTGPQYQHTRGLQPPQADVYRPQSYGNKSIHSLATLKTRQSQGSNIIPIALDSDAASVGDSSYIHPSTASVSSFVSPPRSEDDEMSPSSNYNHLSTFTDGGNSLRLSDYNPSIISPTNATSLGSPGANVHQAVRAKPALIKVDSIRSPPGTAAGGNRRPVILRNISTNDSSHPLSAGASTPLDKEAMESPVLSPDTNAILTHQNSSLTNAFRPESRDTNQSSISEQESTISIENPFSDPVWGGPAPDVNLEVGMSPSTSRPQSTLSELPRGSMASSLPRGLRSSAGSSVFQGDRHLSHTSSIWSNSIPSPGTAPPVPSVPMGFLDSPNGDSPVRNSRNSEIPIFFGRGEDGEDGEETDGGH